MLFKNSVRTSKRTPHFTITKINLLTLLKFKGTYDFETLKYSCVQIPAGDNYNLLRRQYGRAMVQVVSRRPLTAEAQVRAWSIHVGFVVDKMALGQVFLRVLRFSPVNIIPPSLSKPISSGECVIC
jgi:hypothetical protein